MPWHIQYIRVSQAKRSKCANRRTFMSSKFPDMHYSATYCCYQTLWIEKNVNFTSWQSCEHNGCWSPPQSCWTITDHRINVNAIVCYPAVNAGHCSFKTCFFFFPLLVSWSMQFRCARALWHMRKKNKRSTRRQVSGYWSTPTMTRNFMYKIKEAVAVFSPLCLLREALSFPGWFSTRANIL